MKHDPGFHNMSTALDLLRSEVETPGQHHCWKSIHNTQANLTVNSILHIGSGFFKEAPSFNATEEGGEVEGGGGGGGGRGHAAMPILSLEVVHVIKRRTGNVFYNFSLSIKEQYYRCVVYIK